MLQGGEQVAAIRVSDLMLVLQDSACLAGLYSSRHYKTAEESPTVTPEHSVTDQAAPCKRQARYGRPWASRGYVDKATYVHNVAKSCLRSARRPIFLVTSFISDLWSRRSPMALDGCRGSDPTRHANLLISQLYLPLGRGSFLLSFLEDRDHSATFLKNLTAGRRPLPSCSQATDLLMRERQGCR